LPLATFLSAGSVNDYQKDLQFRKLNEQRDVIDVKVVRGGNTVVIKNGDVVVGDILMLDTGDKVGDTRVTHYEWMGAWGGQVILVGRVGDWLCS
jgi:hypothetical protein